jgi:hypothetical protein
LLQVLLEQATPSRATPGRLAQQAAQQAVATLAVLAWMAHRPLEEKASWCMEVAVAQRLPRTQEAFSMTTDCPQQLTFWKVGKQEVTATFDGARVVSDAGLLALRAFEQELQILAEIADRLPDLRAQKFVVHTKEAVLTQRVDQILAGYPDGNDAQVLRHDPLFRTLVGIDPDGEQALASGSTVNRFHYAYTRRQAELPWRNARCCWSSNRP